MSFFAEFWLFVKSRRKFWLIPVLVLMITFGALLIVTQSSAIAPFIYTLF